MVAVWYQDVYNYETGWAYSVDSGQSWNPGANFPLRQPLDYIHGQPSICADSLGTFYVGVTYEDHSTFRATYAIYRGTVAGTGVQWSGPTFVLPLILALPPYDTPRLMCDPRRGYVYLTYTQIPDALHNTSYPLQYTIGFTRSVDSGQSWAAPQLLSSSSSNGSRLVIGDDSTLYVVWEDFGTGQVVGRTSLDYGQSFGAAYPVGDDHDNLGMPPPNWASYFTRDNPGYPGAYSAGPGFPSLAIDRSLGPRTGTLYAVWAEAGQYGTDAGTGSITEQEPNDSYVNATPVSIGQDVSGFELSADQGGQDDDRFTFEGTAGTSILITGTVSFSGGPFPQDNFGYELQCGTDTLSLIHMTRGLIYSDRYIPPLLYTLPTDGKYYLLVDRAGPASIYYTLSLRSVQFAAGQAAEDHRDIVLTSSSDGGLHWTPKMRVNDDLPRFDDAMPEVAVDREGLVHIAWYDRRDDPDCAERISTYWTYSIDGGATFRASKNISAVESNPSAAGVGWRVGDHLALQSIGSDVYALWTQVGQPDVDVHVVRIGADVLTAIAVDAFSADVTGEGVRVRWDVVDGIELAEFRVYRGSGPQGPFEQVGKVITADHDGEYSILDRSVEPGQTYHYRLEVLYRNGTRQWLGPVQLVIGGSVSGLSWVAVSPNPSIGIVRFLLAMPQPGPVRVRVYDVTGHEVVVLGATLGNGGATLEWNGLDRAGRHVPAGVYLLRAESGNQTALRRLVRI